MSRKGPAKTRISNPDPIYVNRVLGKVINYAMRNGKKLPAQKQVYQSLNLVKAETKTEPVAALEQALDNIKPKVEVRPRRIGGAVYQVPTPVRGNRQQSLAIRWLINSARARDNKQFHTFAQKLAAEIIAATKSEGAAVTKRFEVERMAEANKAFAHLRW